MWNEAWEKRPQPIPRRPRSTSRESSPSTRRVHHQPVEKEVGSEAGQEVGQEVEQEVRIYGKVGYGLMMKMKKEGGGRVNFYEKGQILVAVKKMQ